METTQTKQEQSIHSEPQKEHQWLQKFVGEWTYESEVNMGADRPPEKAMGTESVRSLGGFWVLGEGEGEMPGCDVAKTIITLGYDPQKQRYTGTFVASMMTYLWLYDGELDAAKNILTLNSDGPAMTGEGLMAKYKDVIELKSDDHWVMTSHVLGDDGEWHQFMTANYWRKN